MNSLRGEKPRVTLVRGPMVSTVKAVNNESTPCIGLASVAAYIKQHGDEGATVDAMGYRFYRSRILGTVKHVI
jgi:hypothetical protein